MQSCTTYGTLPKNINPSNDIAGSYSNVPILDSMQKRETTLWRILDYKNEIEGDSITVKLEIINEKSIKVTFLEKENVLREKIIKGKFKEDSCFYTRRKFYMFFVLPVLWGYSNKQKRFYKEDDMLIVEITDNHGGVAIIIGSGDKDNYFWKFKSLK